MRSVASPLAPTFRSALQGRVLAATLLDPQREWGLTELAHHLEAPSTSVQDEVTRLIDGQILTDRKVGRTRVVKPHPTNPAVPPLTQLTLVTYGPHTVVAQEFEGLDAERVVIFGSWAARFHGIPGSTPQDIDVMVVGSPARGEVYAAAERADRRLNLEVNPVIRPSDVWDDPKSDPLMDELQRRPFVTVLERDQ